MYNISPQISKETIQQNILQNGTLEDIKKLIKTQQDSQNLVNSSQEKNIFNFARGETALHYAVANSDINVILYLIDEIHVPFDIPSDSGVTPLLKSAYFGNLETIRLLI